MQNQIYVENIVSIAFEESEMISVYAMPDVDIKNRMTAAEARNPYLKKKIKINHLNTTITHFNKFYI